MENSADDRLDLDFWNEIENLSYDEIRSIQIHNDIEQSEPFERFYKKEYDNWETLITNPDIDKYYEEQIDDEEYEKRILNRIDSINKYSVDNWNEFLKSWPRPVFWPNIHIGKRGDNHRYYIWPWITGYDHEKTYTDEKGFIYYMPIMTYRNIYSDIDGQIKEYEKLADCYDEKIIRLKDKMPSVGFFFIKLILFLIAAGISRLICWLVGTILINGVLSFIVTLVNPSMTRAVFDSNLSVWILWIIQLVIFFRLIFVPDIEKLKNVPDLKKEIEEAEREKEPFKEKIKVLKSRPNVNTKHTKEYDFAENWQRAWYDYCCEEISRKYK